MKFSTVAVAASAAAVASASYANTTTVESDVFVTYCPTSGVYTFGNSTLTVTEPTTITITSCGCTDKTTAAPTTAAPVESSAKANVTSASATSVVGAAGKVGYASGAIAGVVAVAAYLL